jgi:hypothetical protein
MIFVCLVIARIYKPYKLRELISAVWVFACVFYAAVGLVRSFYSLGFCYGVQFELAV